MVTRAKEIITNSGKKLLKGIKLFSPKVAPEERTRAPNFQEAMHDALMTKVTKTCTHTMPDTGPVVDSAATVPAVCKRDIKHLTNIRVLEEPLRVDVEPIQLQCGLPHPRAYTHYLQC